MEIFKEVSVGGVDKVAVIQKLVGAGVRFNISAETLFEDPAFAPPSVISKLQLVKVAPADLGLGASYSYESVISQGEKVGLHVCPLYLGAFLRLKYLDQPAGPYLTIVSPFRANDDGPAGFYVRNHEGSLWLRGYSVSGEAEWPASNEFIFLR